MHLMCRIDEATGKRVYTLKKVVDSKVTKSAHPARFSPDDKWSRHRVTLKKRFGLLLTQKSAHLLPPHRRTGLDFDSLPYREPEGGGNTGMRNGPSSSSSSSSSARRSAAAIATDYGRYDTH